jgi:MFS family permease
LAGPLDEGGWRDGDDATDRASDTRRRLLNVSEPIAAAGPARMTGVDPTTLGPRAPTVVLGVLFIVYFISSVDRSIFMILAQPIKEELLLSDMQLGFLTGFAFSLVTLVFGFPMAWVTDKGNRVNILTICIAFWSIMTAVSGLCSNFVQLTLARMGVGVGEAACLPASHSLISDYYPPLKRTKALAIFGLGYPGGALIGMLVGGAVLDHWGWRAAFYVVGLPGLLIALMTWLVVKEPQRGRFDPPAQGDAKSGDGQSFKEVALIMWRSPVLRQMVIALTLVSVFTSPTATFLGPYIVRRFPVSYTELSWIMVFAMMLPASISTIVGGIIIQRMGARDIRWMMWFPGITLALGSVPYVIALAQSEWPMLVAFMFFGALINATFLAPSYTVLHNSIPPGGRAKAVVILGLFMGMVGHSIGPLIAGAANDLIAGMQFGNTAPGGFMAACPGGQAATGASAALDAACRGALANATQWVMMATMALTVWPAFHFYLAGRHMKQGSAPIEPVINPGH